MLCIICPFTCTREVDCDAWLLHLDQRQARVQPIWPAARRCPRRNRRTLTRGLRYLAKTLVPPWAVVTRDPMQGSWRQLPWQAPVSHAVEGGSEFVPGLA